ncbi:MAG TPA: NADPH-dependent FMN reductase, partial [Polyangiaceae bacterium]|nr:NADPH-dependent FMN reductase [Polyangiaceae bacterium]
MKILAVAGSLQARSSNKSLLELAARLATGGVEWKLSHLLGELPLYDADADVDPPPPPVARFRAELDAADAVVFASPEYGHGMPGSVKNALDWIVGSANFNNKPVAATCAAAGPARGERGLAMLTQTLRAIDAVVIWESPIVVPRNAIQPDGTIVSEDVERALGELTKAVVD